MVNQSYLVTGLRLQNPHQIGVGHGGEWMVLHAAFIEQHLADKQIALEHGAPVVRESRRCHREIAAQRRHQRICHRTNIAPGRAVKGGAVFEVNLLRPLRLQPLQGGQRLGHCLGSINRARFKRHHHRVDLASQGR